MNTAAVDSPRRASDEDDIDDAEEVDIDEGDDVDAGDEDMPAIADPEDDAPPRVATRPRAMRPPNPAHRQPIAKTEAPAGSSWWLGKSREALAREAEERSPQMGNTKEGRKVRALPT